MADRETCAGSYPGAKNMGLSLKRAGSSYVEATGEMGAAGESPSKPKGHKFSPSGTSRKGSTAGASYSPYAPTAPEAYRGGVGTGQNGGKQG